MKIHAMSMRLTTASLLAFGLVLLPAWVFAQQQTPVTGAMMDGQHAVAAPSTAVTQPMFAESDASKPSPTPSATSERAASANLHIGDTTQHLLQMQADGSQAGRHLPMLGDEASASYRRYMKSFNHDIPEFYETTVGKDTGNGK